MKIISATALDALSRQAEASPRRRAHLNIHADTAEPINRLVIALEPGTYIRPHRHPDKFELFILLSGRALLLGFDDAGRVTSRLSLAAGMDRIAEFPPGSWHTVVALETGTLMLEVKPGPYQPTPEADFAAWAPPEGADTSKTCLDWLRDQAREGLLWQR